MIPTIITGIRATRPEYGVYVRNLAYCAEAVLKQTVKPEFIIVDYGSIPYYQEKIKKIAEKTNATYVYAPGDIWSRSLALNAGIKAAKCGLLLIIDVDSVIPPNYVSAHLDAHKVEKNICTYSLVYDTFGDIEKSSDYGKLLAQKDKIKKPREDGMSHIGIQKDWFSQHGLYGEKYKGWGAEDSSLWLRIKKSNLKPRPIKPLPVHLWHPDYGFLLSSIGGANFYKNLVHANRVMYFAELKNQ